MHVLNVHITIKYLLYCLKMKGRSMTKGYAVQNAQFSHIPGILQSLTLVMRYVCEFVLKKNFAFDRMTVFFFFFVLLLVSYLNQYTKVINFQNFHIKIIHVIKHQNRLSCTYVCVRRTCARKCILKVGITCLFAANIPPVG